MWVRGVGGIFDFALALLSTGWAGSSCCCKADGWHGVAAPVPKPSGEGFLVSGCRKMESTSKSIAKPKNPPGIGKMKNW